MVRLQFVYFLGSAALSSTHAYGGVPSPRSRKSNPFKSAEKLSPEANKARKAAARADAAAKLDKKLSAEAEFFWKCSRKAQGTSKFNPPTPAELFGSNSELKNSVKAAGSLQQHPANVASEVAISVTRSGAVGSDVPELNSFETLAEERVLPPFVVANLLGPSRMAYRAPTPIQRHTVPLGLAGHDVMASAQTGSGKTVAFLLPLITALDAANRQHQHHGTPSQQQRPHGHTGERLNFAKACAESRRPASPSALILAPTRELAMQIELEVFKLTHATRQSRGGSASSSPSPRQQRQQQPQQLSEEGGQAARWCCAVYGGANARPQLEALAGGVEILVATPGRLVDFVGRGLVSLKRCRFLVLDEADRMLDMGFEPQLKRIVEGHDLPRKEERQTLMFSATFAPPIQAIATRYLRPAFAHVAVGRVGASNADVEQRLVRCSHGGDKHEKLELLVPLLLKDRENAAAAAAAGAEPTTTGRGGEAPTKRTKQGPRAETAAAVGRTIVFVNKKHVASWVARELARKGLGLQVSEVHGGRSQPQREAALAAFRAGQVDVLVATDAVARGIDVPDVQHVVQFDLPLTAKEFEAYTHRIGRTGRAGKRGVATALYVPGAEPKVGNADLWHSLKKSFEEAKQELPDWFEAEERGGKPLGLLGGTDSRRRGAAKAVAPASGSSSSSAGTGAAKRRKQTTRVRKNINSNAPG